MRILIVIPKYAPGDHRSYNYMFPLGLAYISAVLKQAGHQVDCLNLNHYNGTVDSFIRNHLLTNEKYDFVCTGGIAVDYLRVKQIAESVNNWGKEPRLILGGGLISSEPELMFNALNPDYIVIGEGEQTIVELMACLENGGDIEKVNGIGYCDNGGKVTFTNMRKQIMDLDSIPLYDVEGIEFEDYVKHSRPSDGYLYDIFDFPRPYPIVLSRGCPYSCTFCYHPIGKKYRQRSIDSAVQELRERIIQYRINIIIMYDELFMHDSE